MAEHGLQEANVGPVLQHGRGAGVPEQVTSPHLAEIGGVDVLADKIGHALA